MGSGSHADDDGGRPHLDDHPLVRRQDAAPVQLHPWSWEALEKDAGCGGIPNRTLTTDFSAGGAQAVADTVEKWRDIDACG
jgi:hypothetical protein